MKTELKKMTKKQIKSLDKWLDQPIHNTWGTNNKICPQCLFRMGHPLVYCSKCGHKTVDFKDVPNTITYRQWLLKAVDKEDRHRRAYAVLWETNWHKKSMEDRDQIVREIIKLIEK